MNNKYKYILIGLLAGITILIFVLGLNFLKGKNYFIQEDTYYVVYDRIEGLTKSSPVLLNGYNVGQVRDIRFNNLKKGDLVVKFVVEKDIHIPKQSIARIFSQDLMGTKAIDLVFSDQDSLLSSGDTLIPETEESLKEQVSIEMLPLKNKAEDLLQEMEYAIKIINSIFNERTQQNLKQIIEELNYTSKNLRSSTASIDTLLIKENKRIHRLLVNLESITNNFSKNNENITGLMANLKTLTDSLKKADFNSTVDEVDSTLMAINNVLRKIQTQEGTLGKLIYNDSLYNALNRSTEDIGLLAEDLRVNPKRYLHFSAFDLGRTMYVLDEDKMKNRAQKNEGVFYVLIDESPSPVSLDYYDKIDKVEQRIVDDTYLYTAGSFDKKRKAKRFLRKVRKQYSDARLIYVNKGQYSYIDK